MNPYNKKFRAMFLSNRAASYMKLFRWELAIEDCTKAIELGKTPNDNSAPNDKPLERRATAHSMIPENLKYALEDYTTLAQKYPERSFYKERINSLKEQMARRPEERPKELFEWLKKALDEKVIEPTLKALSASAQYAGITCGTAIRRLFL
ncbi:unnamed protein product [Enterobius vermicularis]|uniref:TPR_REGION domain-containing protein n=1 Tax=Enterobius vermicularis TaxID=51028 RepID=A0A0N4UUZ6_ENTVE|nr:unnamed protein product [Enterobius vermicularis]